MDKKKKHVLLLDLALIICASLITCVTGTMMTVLPDCAFATTSFQCPACGGTRCIQSMFRGDLAASFQMNPYIFLSVCFLALLIILLNTATILEHRLSQKLLRILATPVSVIIWAIGFALFGILRNLL